MRKRESMRVRARESTRESKRESKRERAREREEGGGEREREFVCMNHLKYAILFIGYGHTIY